MPKGPRGEKRPADTNACAVTVAKIATGEIEDERYAAPGRKKSGKAGGAARARSLKEDERREIARRAAIKRWKGRRPAMTSTSECARLADRFQAMKADGGLVDMKFFFGQVSESTVDDFCEEVNRLYKLVEEGKYKKVEKWGDGKGFPDTP